MQWKLVQTMAKSTCAACVSLLPASIVKERFGGMKSMECALIPECAKCVRTCAKYDI